MPKVPVYQQGQLASSVIGTPGVYTGASAPLGTISADFGNAASSLFNIANSLHSATLNAQREKEAELVAYNRKLKEAEQEASIAERVGGVEVGLTDLTSSLKTNYRSDTAGALREYQTQAQGVFKPVIDAEPDPLVKAKLKTAFAKKNAEYQSGMLRWSEDRQVPIMTEKITALAGHFSQSVGDASLSAAEVGQKYHNFQQENSGLYQFRYGEAAPVKMREDMAEGVKSYLHATALNAPELLEPRIKAFSGGGFIDAGDLDHFAIQQRQIANQIRQTQLAEQTQAQSGAYLEARQRILASSETGDLKDADPAAVSQVEKEYGPKLTPENRFKLQQLTKVAATQKVQRAEQAAAQAETAARRQLSTQQRLERGKAMVEEENIAGNFATWASQEKALSANINSQLLDLKKGGKSKEELQAALAKLQLDVDHYADAHDAMTAIKGAFTTPKAKDLAELHLIQAKERFSQLTAKLGKLQSAVEAHRDKEAIYSKAYPPSLFSDPKKQGVFNYLYQSYFYEHINTVAPEKFKLAAADPKYIQTLQRTLKEKAYRKMMELNISEVHR